MWKHYSGLGPISRTFNPLDQLSDEPRLQEELRLLLASAKNANESLPCGVRIDIADETTIHDLSMNDESFLDVLPVCIKRPLRTSVCTIRSRSSWS